MNISNVDRSVIGVVYGNVAPNTKGVYECEIILNGKRESLYIGKSDSNVKGRWKSEDITIRLFPKKTDFTRVWSISLEVAKKPVFTSNPVTSRF
jgi:hypothetical protein